MIWEEVFGYLQRLLATSNPLTELPELVPGSESIETVLLNLVEYLVNASELGIKYSARTLLVTLNALAPHGKNGGKNGGKKE